MPKYKIFAAIEIGSTKISMQIAEISKSKLISVIENVSYEIPIGKETYTIGKISYENVDKICKILEKAVILMNDYRVDDYSCYATTAVREAFNSEYIIEQINIRTGLKVSILSNEEERFLHNKAIALKTGYFDDIIKKGAVLVDASSGFVQVSYYKNSSLKYSEKLLIGSLRIMETLSDIKREKDIFAGFVLKHINSEIEKLKIRCMFNNDYEYAVFFGNHTDTIKKIVKKEGSDTLSYKLLEEAYNAFINRNIDDMAYELDILYDELELTFVTVLIFKSFADIKKDALIIVPEITLTDGICVEYVEKNGYTHTKHMFTNDILSSCMYCAQKYNVNIKHIEKSIEFCEQIFKSLSKRYNLSKHDLILLKAAAIFADTGMYISVNGYSMYSSYIVKATPIIGLSKNDMDIISNVVLMNESSAIIPTKRRRLLVSKLSSILIMAKTLDVEKNQNIRSINVFLKNNEFIVEAHSDNSIIFEMKKFEAAKKSFEDVFGIIAELKPAKKMER